MFRKNYFGAWSAILLVVAAATLVFTGCSSKSTSNDTSSGTSVVVTASPTTIEVGETSVVEGTVEVGGEALANQTVVFSVSPSNAGYFSPEVDTTDANGVAATIFTATSSGAVIITASLEGSSASSTISLAIEDNSGSGTGNVDIVASPSLLLANGEDTSLITITVRDALGQPAPDSTLVKITAGEKFVDIDGNGYWSDGIDSLVFDANANSDWDGIGLIPSTAVTSGGAGTVTVSYISGYDAMTVYIKVTVDDNGITGNSEISLQLSASTTMHAIFLASDSLQLSVSQTGGIESGLLHATGYDINGNSVPEGLLISFVILDGPGGGEKLADVGYGPYSAYTNSQGMATAPIHSGTVSGTIRIRAYFDTILSNAAQVLVSAGPPTYIVVGAKECNVDFWDDVAFENEITAVVSDIYLNPVNDNTSVYFSTDEGTMKSHEERTKDLNGIATTVWYSGNNVDTADGVVAVMAETAGGTVADTAYFFNTHFPAVLSVSGWQTHLLADGEANFYVWVSAVDLNGNPVIGGTEFRAEAQYLGVTGGSFEDGCYSASARVKVSSKTLRVDASVTGANDDGVGAVDWVTYWHEAGASVSQACSLLTGNAYSGQSTINAQSSASPSEVVHITVIIKDRYGNPLADHTLNMVASAGTVNGATQETDAYGEAVGFTWSSGALGDATLTVTDTDPRGGIILTHKITVE